MITTEDDDDDDDDDETTDRLLKLKPPSLSLTLTNHSQLAETPAVSV